MKTKIKTKKEANDEYRMAIFKADTILQQDIEKAEAKKERAYDRAAAKRKKTKTK